MKKSIVLQGFIFLLIGISTRFLITPISGGESGKLYIPDPNSVIKDSLTHEVESYINSKFPKSGLSAESLVEACLEHEFDIVLALAQGQIESGLGSAGAAKRTNSVWNVGHYDNRTTNYVIQSGLGFNHPDESIVPYITLVKRKYLGDRKTVDDLLRNYVSLGGYRYASDKSYERKLRETYRNIKRETNIGTLFEMMV